ncbi:hypothetical protein AMAG_19141 [Allomyces macrogynus ATCC 38327]|uniref:Uncharacterized protein n=1 Tax=Allomyces macrogynus (strain ATCC 38327) TaxID=578462 RepID=A0A0L0SP08_ALLM3|nr:hypothetical protein AMAG_19141 [Allomyces macrogynus ATCC 38327]|eukprot:KNE64256.1 hypothetical protein AMAG_19141 [Allomyces macrogynus ATCC 38327]
MLGVGRAVAVVGVVKTAWSVEWRTTQVASRTECVSTANTPTARSIAVDPRALQSAGHRHLLGSSAHAQLCSAGLQRNEPTIGKCTKLLVDNRVLSRCSGRPPPAAPRIDPNEQGKCSPPFVFGRGGANSSGSGARHHPHPASLRRRDQHRPQDPDRIAIYRGSSMNETGWTPLWHLHGQDGIVKERIGG